MGFIRTTSVDTTRPDADTERSAVMDLDQDLTGAFKGLNTVESDIATRLRLSVIGTSDGVCDLDDDTLIPISRIPNYPSDKLPGAIGYPIGFILPFPTDTIPTVIAGSWVECNGASLSRSTYATLYEILGTRFGTNGSTDFKIPDMRGYVPRGWDHGSGKDPDATSRTNSGNGTAGDHVGTAQASQNISHSHNMLTAGSTMGNGDGHSGVEYYSIGDSSRSIISSTGGNEFRPINIAMQFIIRVL